MLVLAAKHQQWSEDANSNTQTALKGAGAQAKQIEGDEETRIKQLEAQAGGASGSLEAQQTAMALAVETVRQIQKLRQLLFANLQLQASFVQTGQDQAAVKQANHAKYFKWTDIPENNGKNY